MLRLRTSSEPLVGWRTTHTEERLRIVFRPAVCKFFFVKLAFPFFLIKIKKNKTLLPDVVFTNFNKFFVFFVRCATWFFLRLLAVQELLLGWGDAAVPGAGVVRPLDAGVVVGLASVHLLIDHQVGPQTLLRSRDLTGQRGTAHDLHTEHTEQAQLPHSLQGWQAGNTLLWMERRKHNLRI